MKKMPSHLPPLPDGYVYAGRLGDYGEGKRLHGVIFEPGDVGWVGPDIWSGVGGYTKSGGWHYAAPADSEIARLNGCGKPSWDDAPEWAEWLAQDADGGWVWYELKPRVGPISASDDGFEDWLLGRLRGLYEDAGEGQPNPNWRDTLERRPSKPFYASAADFWVGTMKCDSTPDLIIPKDAADQIGLSLIVGALCEIGYRVEVDRGVVRGWARE